MGKDESNFLRKNREIEVCSDEDGFKGAWFKAILIDCPKAKIKLKVRYLALQADDGSPLCETTYGKFFRPVPPENLFSTDDFEEGFVVEADHRDEWWTGSFVKKIDDDKHLVFFNSPPDLIQFKRKQLRQHFEWSNRKWFKPQNKEFSNNSSFSCGTLMVKVMEKSKGVVWIPAIVVKEMDNGRTFIVKSCKYLSWNDETKPNRTISSRNTRPVPPPLCVETYELNEAVEVFIDPGWRLGRVKDILCGKEYTVRLNATNELVVFQHSDLRPSMESISKRLMQKSTEENAATITLLKGL